MQHINDRDVLAPRAVLDLETRYAILTGSHRPLEVASEDLTFWTEYANLVSPAQVHLVPRERFPQYPRPNGRRALWFSGGVESSYARAVVEKDVVLLSISNYAVFESKHRKVGQIHFLCAVVSASLGFSHSYMGMEKDDFLISRQPSSWPFFERHPDFCDLWSTAHADHSISSPCSHLNKEEVMVELDRLGIRIMGTCDKREDGSWCGECYKCFEAFYFSRAADVDLGIELSRGACEKYYASYRRYVDSGFLDNFNTSYHRFARLAMKFCIEINPEGDCVRA